MDSWLDSPLNKAHFYDRRANALAQKLCFDEALECHLSAAKYLVESLKLTDNEKAKESILLQKEYHLKQNEVLRLKKLQHQAFKEVIRVQKEALSRMMKVRDSNGKYSGSEKEELCIQKAIYKTIEEADSLLEILVHKEETKDDDSESARDEEGNSLKPKGSTHPKDDKTVIEELRIVNYQLRTLISELMSKLTASEKEVERLKQRVAELEEENRRLAPEFSFLIQGDRDEASEDFRNGSTVCKNLVVGVSYKLGEALKGFDSVRDIVTSTGIDAMSRDRSFGPIITCFVMEVDSYIQLGNEISLMIHNTTVAISEILKNKGEKCEVLLEDPLTIIANTMKELPGKIVKYKTQLNFLKALQVVLEARKIIDKNGRKIGEVLQKISGEVPQLTVEVHTMVDGIFSVAKNGSEIISNHFNTCMNGLKTKYNVLQL